MEGFGDRCCQGRGATEALCWVLCESLQNDCRESRWDSGINKDRGLWCGNHMLHQNSGNILPLERTYSSADLVENDSERVDVAPFGNKTALSAFRRNIKGCP